MVLLVVLITLVLTASITALQWKMMRSEAEVHRQEVLRRGPIPRSELVRTTAVTLAIYGSLGMAFYLGWRASGVEAGVVAAVIAATVGCLIAAAWAIRDGWVPRQ